MIDVRIFFRLSLSSMTALTIPPSLMLHNFFNRKNMALFYFYAWNVSMQSAPEAATDHLANRRNEGAEKGRGTVWETGEGWQGRLVAWVYKQLLYDALFFLSSVVDTFSLKRQIFTSLEKNVTSTIWLMIICFKKYIPNERMKFLSRWSWFDVQNVTILVFVTFFIDDAASPGNYFATIYSALAKLYHRPCLYYLSCPRDCETEDKETEEE